ncbi:MAG: accessory gene regulator B family protein [Oscillospiraceae bacterium]|jgi:accessory gene regulator B|nr:accessory gene regulator B family protein [Oscillospiraceae bacterium]
MMHRIAEQCARKLTDRQVIRPAEMEVYTYGFEQILSTGIILLTILLLACLTGSAAAGVLFIVCFVPVRIFAGGFHCRTYGGCFFFSNGMFLLALLLTWLFARLPANVTVLLDCVVVLLCCCAVFAVAPVQNSNNPLTATKVRRNRCRARRTIAVQAPVILFASLTCYVRQIDLFFCSLAAVSTALSAALMMAAWLQKKEGGNS